LQDQSAAFEISSMANPDMATGEASAERPSDLQELLTMAKQLAEELLKAL